MNTGRTDGLKFVLAKAGSGLYSSAPQTNDKEKKDEPIRGLIGYGKHDDIEGDDQERVRAA